MASIEQEFRERCAAIDALELAGSGSLAEVEPAVLELVAVCRGWVQGNREQLVGLFDRAIRDNWLEDDVICYCMHCLRLNEVLQHAEAHCDDPPPGSRAVQFRAFVEELRGAFSNDWDGAVLWASLRQSP